MFLYISLEEKKKETPGLYPTRDLARKMIKIIINTITKLRSKTANATQDKLEFER